MSIIEAESFFRDPRCRAMIRAFHAFGKLSGNDLCEVMGVRYPDDVSGRHMTACTFHSRRAHVNSCLRRFFKMHIASRGIDLADQYWIETTEGK